MAIVSIVLIALGAYNTLQERARLEHELTLAAEQARQQIELTLPKPLWDFAEGTVRQFTTAVMANPAVYAILVRDNKDKHVVGLAKSGNGIQSVQTIDDSEWRVTQVKLTFEIDGEQQSVGHATVYIDPTVITDRMRSAIVDIFIQLIVIDLCLLAGLNWLSERVVLRPLNQILSRVNEMSAGEADLTHTLVIDRHDELGQLAASINDFNASLRTLVKEVITSMEDLAAASRVSESAVSSLVEPLSRQAEHLQALNDSLQTVSLSNRSIQESASHTAGKVSDTLAATAIGVKRVSDASQMTQGLADNVSRASSTILVLAEHSEKISSILDAIRSISDQTNLLALNASIEAARAGEHGRGFAVVADEVRVLAGRSQQAASEIKEMIDGLQGKAREAAAAVEGGQAIAARTVEVGAEASSSFADVNDAIKIIDQMASRIVEVVNQQDNLVGTLQGISKQIGIVHEQTDSASMTTRDASSRQLSGVARIKSLLSRFKV